ncbi:hypothetical protein OG369_42805 [Streptomyces sp. NBC_01221]|uniref:hypothetical protein n=1 Tax=Streptomyces sp. NBC_01221 TaxID=2903782 RepID=UPI00224F3055|nr:hypothetical protein [Streptomyces sp. NBC_01221]MCX4792509.1 hypothetical protein [Streptomyces sp. NBC_01221]
MSIDTSFDLQPTAPDLTDDEQNIDATPSTAPATPAPAPSPAPQVEHTDGGLPAIPLLVITSNTAAAGLSAATLAAGPLAAAGIAAGTLVTAVAVSARSRKKTKTAARRAAPKPAPKKITGSTGRGSVPAARRTSAGTSSSNRTGGLGAAKKTTPTKTLPSKASAAKKPAAKAPAAGGGGNRKRTSAGGTNSAAGKGGRVGQIKALRAAKKAEGKTRKQQREQATQTRRALKDGRRGEKAALKNLKKKPHTDGKNNPAAGGIRKAGKAGIGASLKKSAAKQTAGTRTKARNSKDQAVLSRGQRIKQARRKAKARAAMSRKILSAKARYGVKAAGAALLAAPVGLIGCLTTPLGRKLGWSWLMHPGRRLFRRLTADAKYNLRARIEDAKNTYAYDTNPESLDSVPTELIAAAVPRGPRRHTITLGEPVMSDLKFHFDESAADMEAAAAAYEPGGMIHVYQTIQGMPAGIQSWANTFKILAEKSDESFPLDPSVGEGLGDVFDLLQKAAAAAEEVQKTFETQHEHDLARLNDPRKSLEAEKGWDITANEDLL